MSLRALVGVTLTASVLSACGGGPAETVAPSAATTSASGVPLSPTGGPPQTPAAVQGSGDGAALAFVEFYVATHNYAYATGEVKELAGLADADCRECASTVSYLENLYSAGGSIAGGTWEVIDTQVADAAAGPQDQLVVEATVKVDAATTVGASNSPPDSTAANPQQVLTFGLTRASGDWLVTRVSSPTT